MKKITSFIKKENDSEEDIYESKKHTYSYKKDAMSAFFMGDISAKELTRISKESFDSDIATKKELKMFLTNKFMLGMMSDEQGISVDKLTKKIKELLPLVESINEKLDESKKVKVSDFKRPYSELADATLKIRFIATSNDDSRLRAKMIDLEKEILLIKDYLDSKYIWK